jgi:hypothetical protein
VRTVARHRRWVGWLCAVAVLWAGVAGQRHLLAHAVDALHAPHLQGAAAVHVLNAPSAGLRPAHPSWGSSKGAEPHLPEGCALCLQFAGLDAVSAPPPVPPAMLGSSGIEPPGLEPPWRAEPFVAYAPRAPPAA